MPQPALGASERTLDNNQDDFWYVLSYVRRNVHAKRNWKNVVLYLHQNMFLSKFCQTPVLWSNHHDVNKDGDVCFWGHITCTLLNSPKPDAHFQLVVLFIHVFWCDVSTLELPAVVIPDFSRMDLQHWGNVGQQRQHQDGQTSFYVKRLLHIAVSYSRASFSLASSYIPWLPVSLKPIRVLLAST